MKLSEKKTITARDSSKVEGCFWSVTVPFKLAHSSNYSFDYSYSIYNSITKTSIWEKDSRKMNILIDPESQRIKRFLNENSKTNLLLVNWLIDQYDINFVVKMKYHRMGDFNIILDHMYKALMTCKN